MNRSIRSLGVAVFAAGLVMASEASARGVSTTAYTPPPPNPDAQAQTALYRVAQALGIDAYVTDASYVANGTVAQTPPVPATPPVLPLPETCGTQVVPPQITIPLDNTSFGVGNPVSYQSSLRYLGATISFSYCMIAGLIPDLTTFIPGGEIDARQVGTLTWSLPKYNNLILQKRLIDSQFAFGVNFIGFSVFANPLWLTNPASVLNIPFALNGSLSTSIKTTLGAADKPFSDAQLSFKVDDARFNNGTTLATLLNALQAEDVVAILKMIQISASYSSSINFVGGKSATVSGRLFVKADDSNATMDIGLDNSTMVLHVVVPLSALQGLGYAKQVPALVTQ